MLTMGSGVASAETRFSSVVPAPVSARPDSSQNFEITRDTKIFAGSADAVAVGQYLAGVLRPSTGFPLPVTRSDREDGGISLRLGASRQVGDAGYELTVARHG